MNRPIRRLAVAFMVLFFLLLANVNYLQVFQAEDLNSRADNRRVVLDEYARERGPIVVGGERVAYSVKTDDELVYLRKYADPSMYAHLTGFYSFLVGRSGLEQAENPILAGTDDRLFVRRIVDLVTDRQPRGGSVLLTIDPRVQRAALRAMGDKKGAVVAIEPSTGKILAMISRPAYNPNPLASHDPGVIDKAWKSLLNDKDKRSENRAIQRRYPPGSTFKLVTSAAALSSGDYTPATQIPAPLELDLPQSTRVLRNWGGSACGPGNQVSLEDALRVSCNTAFGALGLELGDDALREQAEKFGFGTRFFTELGGASSVFPDEVDQPQTVLSAIGQYEVATTPLQMAMVTAGIANGGEVMKPYVVDKVRGPDLRPLEITQSEVASRAVSPRVADQLTQMMETVVREGTGTPAQMDGIEVAGKTGTAQTTPDRPPFAWFVSFAPSDNPQVAVAVAIEEASVARDDISGGRLAAPVATAVMEAVIGR